MENITLGQVITTLVFILLAINTITNLIDKFKSPIDKKLGTTIDKSLEPIKKDIDFLKGEIKDLKEVHKKDKIEEIKRDLINLMNLAEQGSISEEQKKLAHELFDAYTSAGLNSYVHAKWEKLEKEGKI